MPYGKMYLDKSFNGYRDKLRRYDSVLFVLERAQEKQWRALSKIEIQKCVYLVQVIAPLYNWIENFVKYHTYHFGPYSPDIQNAVDHLVALEYATITNYEPGEDGKIKVSYKITSQGKLIVDELKSVHKLKKIWEIVDVVVGLVGIYHLENLINLVYQEPTFKQLRIQGEKGKNIPIGANLENQTVSTIKELLEIGHSRFEYRNLSVETILVIYFDYLFENHKIENSEGTDIGF